MALHTFTRACTTVLLSAPLSFACGTDESEFDNPICEFPQAPRDISDFVGTHDRVVNKGGAPNLCNVHFHVPFEHDGLSEARSSVESSPGGRCTDLVSPGAQVEFHWVYTSCDLPNPALPGLNNCVCGQNETTVLRVFAQGYVVAADGDGPVQPTEALTSYSGSTTGPSYDNAMCSPLGVNWEVNRTVEPIGQPALMDWCTNNPWLDEQDKVHGARALVFEPSWLSPI